MPTPGSILDLRRWHLTLPTGPAESPKEISPAELVAGWSVAPWFQVAPDGGVRFRAAVNGVTTSGSSNPRCELRERNADGSHAAWSATKGAHALTVVEAFTALPNPRTDSGIAGVVGAQIHDSADDVTVFRLEGTKLYVTRGNVNHYALADANYVLGTRFEARYVVYQGEIRAWYNGRLVATIPWTGSGLYFKAGCYTQANCGNTSPCSDGNYGETTIWAVTVEHADKPGSVVSPEPAPAPTPPPPPPPPLDPPPTPTPTGATIMLIRHGEKPAGKIRGVTSDGRQDSASLTVAGWQRAGALVGLFTPPATGLRTPDAIYAADGPRAGERMVQTVSALSAKLGLATNVKFDKGQHAELAKELASRTGVTLVAWEHSGIPAIATALGAPHPSSWPDDRFDVVWRFDRTVNGWTFAQMPQRLLAGDRDTGI